MKTVLWSETYFQKLGEILKQQDITGEILLTERTMLLLDIHHREVSKDVYVYFGPGEALREGARLIAEQEGLPPYWLKQTIESCFLGRTPSDGATYPGLHIYVAPLGYVLTMSLLFGNQMDVNDEVVHDLAKQLGLSTAAEMFSLLNAYLPEQAIPSRVQGKIEHMFAT
jgi:hypothetical protein